MLLIEPAPNSTASDTHFLFKASFHKSNPDANDLMEVTHATSNSRQGVQAQLPWPTFEFKSRSATEIWGYIANLVFKQGESIA
jgi:hypothetical protein